MTDIIDKIRKVAPSAIDKFHADMKRRNSLTDDKIQAILANIFKNLDYDKLSPELQFRYHKIRERI